MNGSYKQLTFDKEKLNQFAQEVQDAGLPVEVRWKKGKKEVSEEKAITFSLELNGVSIFSQTGKEGIVKLDKLSNQEKLPLLTVMKRYDFYTEPNFGLGIGLTVLFVLIEMLIMYANADEMPWIVLFLSIASLLALQWLWTSWLYCMDRLEKRVYKISMVLGFIGYICTAIWSLLLMPMIKAYNRYYLVRAIDSMEKSELYGGVRLRDNRA